MRLRSTQKGFTLVEVLVATALIVMLLGSLVSFSILLAQAQARSKVVAEVENQGLFFMQTVTQSIRNAQSINLPATSTSASTLSLAYANAAQSPTVFALSNSAAMMAQGSTSAAMLISPQVQVSNLTFQNLSASGTPGVIRIQFTVSYASSSGSSIYTYSRSFVGAASLRQLSLH
jgi:prepilin-type N-terminal cleavage/methylation domain-containing protein